MAPVVPGARRGGCGRRGDPMGGRGPMGERGRASATGLGHGPGAWASAMGLGARWRRVAERGGWLGRGARGPPRRGRGGGRGRGDRDRGAARARRRPRAPPDPPRAPDPEPWARRKGRAPRARRRSGAPRRAPSASRARGIAGEGRGEGRGLPNGFALEADVQRVGSPPGSVPGLTRALGAVSAPLASARGADPPGAMCERSASWCSLHSSIRSRAPAIERNRRAFEHSARTRPPEAAMGPLAAGFPDRGCRARRASAGPVGRARARRIRSRRPFGSSRGGLGPRGGGRASRRPGSGPEIHPRSGRNCLSHVAVDERRGEPQTSDTPMPACFQRWNLASDTPIRRHPDTSEPPS